MFANKHSLPVWPVGQLELELGRLAPPLPEQIQPSDSVGYLYGIRCAREIRSARTGPDAWTARGRAGGFRERTCLLSCC